MADLYRCRWQIEVFFKQIKQTLQLGDFLGHNANAVRWQVWTALLTYVLLRYLSHLSQWAHSFTRLFTLLRAALWEKYDLLKLLACYGTAGEGDFRNSSSGRNKPISPATYDSNLWDSTRASTKTMNETPSERTEIPEHDLTKMRLLPLKIKGLRHDFFVMGWL